MTTTPIYRLKRPQRLEAIRPNVGRYCIVRYSPGRNELTRELKGIVLGAAFHATNGTSTGELVIAGPWTVAGEEHFEAAVVGLSTLIDITPTSPKG